MNKILALIFSLSLLMGCSSYTKNLHRFAKELIVNQSDLKAQKLIERFKEYIESEKGRKRQMRLKHKRLFVAKEEKYTKGVQYFFVGIRKKEFKGDFTSKLNSHIKLVLSNTEEAKLLISYYIFATEEYEIALMKWHDELRMKEFFSSPKGKEILSDSSSFMNTLFWKKLD